MSPLGASTLVADRMSAAPVLFDAVFFDLDGTLVATETFWVAAARAGARKAFAELALERELPAADAWLAMVGLPLARGFEAVFPDLDERQRACVMARCVEEEERAVRAGAARLMPGAREVLEELRARHIAIGVASNCTAGYLERMLTGLELRTLIDRALCLDSPGVQDKSEMVAELARSFGTRSAVMVGDRAGDAESAHAQALPHVHLLAGLAPSGEAIASEAVVRDLFELLPALGARARWIESLLAPLSIARAAAVGITGSPASGKSLFARDFARVVTSGGRPAVVLALEDFARAGLAGAPRDDLGLADALELFDLDHLVERVLAPHRRGEVVRAGRPAVPIPPDALVVLEGPWLLHPRLRLALDRVLYLEVSEATSLKRTAARAEDPEALLHLRRVLMPRQREFEASCAPHARADRVESGENPLGPADSEVSRG